MQQISEQDSSTAESNQSLWQEISDPVETMLSNDGVSFPSHKVVIYENSRYSPLSGWNNKSLLLTDRKLFSNRDGQDGWASLEEASTTVCPKGNINLRNYLVGLSNELCLYGRLDLGSRYTFMDHRTDSTRCRPRGLVLCDRLQSVPHQHRQHFTTLQPIRCHA
jgi:hypothetical protein